MAKVGKRGGQIRKYLVENVEKFPQDVATRAAQAFGVSRQAVNKHVRQLVQERALIIEGNTRSRIYKLCPLTQWAKSYEIAGALNEDMIWRDVAPLLGQLPKNVMSIWHYGLTEMCNNSIDHSGGKTIDVQFEKTATSASLLVADNGIGIFKKIQNALGLLDERHAVLELAKGKFTTDPVNHTGEGIFFSSRMFDDFTIISGGTCFSHEFDKDGDWVFEASPPADGTGIRMILSNHTSRTMGKVFAEFSSGDDFAFDKTIVPVSLAQYGDDQLISRSQAKRLLERVDRFKTVIFDFSNVASVGQAFADEIFRVFRHRHPEMEIYGINANSEVRQMIKRAEAAAKE